ncbi:hypothetical protein WA577_002646 [Blastocystis sp. JDR]
MTYDLSKLEPFKEIDDLTICFYGGEPLLKNRTIYKIMDMFPKARFCLQTNATLLKTVKDDYLMKMDTILCSIDGRPEITNKCRGNGTYERIIENVECIKAKGFKNDIVARMTVSVSQGGDIYEEVMHLINKGFKHVHWQLDCNWDTPDNERIEEWCQWRDTSYNPGITRLADEFERELENGRILPIAPFTGVLYSMLIGEKVTGVRCGSGMTSFNITTGGGVSTCPIAAELDCVTYITKEGFHPKKLYNAELIGEPCTSCDILHECGGRCLYANQTKWWGEDGFQEVCKSIRHLMKEMHRILPAVQKSIESGKFTVEDFHYPAYNNSIEVIP